MTDHTSRLKLPDPMEPTGEYPFSSLVDGYSDSCTPLIHSFFGLFPNAFSDRGEIQKEGNWKKEFYTGQLTDDAHLLKLQQEKLQDLEMFRKVIVNPHFFDRLADHLGCERNSKAINESATMRDRVDLFFNSRARFHPYHANELENVNQIVACQCCNREETFTAWDNRIETSDKLSASKNYGKHYDANDLLMFEMGNCHEWYVEKIQDQRGVTASFSFPRIFTEGIYFFCWSCVNSKVASSASPLIAICEHCVKFNWLNETRLTVDPVDNEMRVCNDCYHDNIAPCDYCCETFFLGEGSAERGFYSWEHEYIGTDYSQVCSACLGRLEEEVSDWISERDYEEENENSNLIRCYSTRVALQNMRRVKGRDISGVHSEMIGVELECECRPNSNRHAIAEQIHEAFYQITDSRNFMLIKNDGSLTNGFEIVSTTATLPVHNRVWFEFLTIVQNAIHNKLDAYDYAKFGLLKDLRSFENFSDRRTCGIHVHLDRSNIGTLQERKMNVALNCIENRKLVTTIAQRSRSDFCEYDNSKTMQSSRNGERYAPVNVTSNTLEIRIFNGTLIPSSMVKSIQFADFVRHYSRQNANGYRRLRNGWFLKALEKQSEANRREYGHLLDYVVEHRNKYKDSEHVEFDPFVGQFLDFKRGYRNAKPVINPLELPSKYNLIRTVY